MNFEKWLSQIGKSDRTASSYSSAISGSISEWANSAGVIANNLSEVTNAKQLRGITEDIKKLPAFQEKNTKGKGMYSAALNQYAAYLEDLSNEEIQEDIEAVVSSPDTSKTEKTALVNARVGQGKYRADLINYWDGCALTGYGDVRFLVASHIKPWRESNNNERLDPFNGLLLLPNIDKAFDLGFITFAAAGNIIVSEYLEQAGRLGINHDMHLKIIGDHQEYMQFHRDVVYERKCRD
jgi:predicted restriction endonuclease